MNADYRGEEGRQMEEQMEEQMEGRYNLPEYKHGPWEADRREDERADTICQDMNADYRREDGRQIQSARI